MKLDASTIAALTATATAVAAGLLNVDRTTRRGRAYRQMTQIVAIREKVPPDLVAVVEILDAELSSVAAKLGRPGKEATYWLMVIAAGMLGVALVLAPFTNPGSVLGAIALGDLLAAVLLLLLGLVLQLYSGIVWLRSIPRGPDTPEAQPSNGRAET